MNVLDDGEHAKEVYARFGLAIYRAQVLEHALVNALTFVDLIPSRRSHARSIEEWSAEVDAFHARNFEATMGRLMKKLRSTVNAGPELERILQAALKKRNWLVHDFFRERASEFMSHEGREQMLLEVDECGELFGQADEALEAAVTPARLKSGITDEMLEHEFNRMLQKARGS